MDYLQGLLYLAFDGAAALLLVATWQQTRIVGFLVLAASYVLGIVARWLVPVMYRMQSDDWLSDLWFIILVRPLWFVISGVALLGLWDIYRQLKRPPTTAPPSA
jgi:hypothetical protein